MKFKKLRKMIFVTFLSSNVAVASMPMAALAAEDADNLVRAGGVAQADDLLKEIEAEEEDEEEGDPYYVEHFELEEEEDAEAKKAAEELARREKEQKELQLAIEERAQREKDMEKDYGKVPVIKGERKKEATKELTSHRDGGDYFQFVQVSDTENASSPKRWVGYHVDGKFLEMNIELEDVINDAILNYGSMRYSWRINFTDGNDNYFFQVEIPYDEPGVYTLDQLEATLCKRNDEYSYSSGPCDVYVSGDQLYFMGTLDDWLAENFAPGNVSVTSYSHVNYVAYAMENSYMTWSIDDNGKLTIRNAEAGSSGMSFLPLYEQCSKVKSLDVYVTNMITWDRMFAGFPNLTTATVKASGATTLDRLFEGCRKLKSVKFTLRDTNNLNNMYGMFQNCEKLTSVNFGTLDTSNVEYFSHMFHGCASLETLDLSALNTQRAHQMYSMFAMNGTQEEEYGETVYESKLKSINFGDNFDTSNVEYMNSMFEGCVALESLDLSGFDTSNLSSASCMFYGCESLVELDLSSFDLSAIMGDEIYGMLVGTSSLQTIHSPKNLKAACYLPSHAYWRNEETMEEEEELPKNQRNSVLLTARMAAPYIESIGYGEKRYFINWMTWADCKKYRIMRRIGTGAWTVLAEVEATGAEVETYIDDKVAYGRRYTYYIVGISDDGSEELTIRGMQESVKGEVDTNAPRLIQTLSYRSGIKLYWEPNMCVENYCVYRKTKGGNWKKLGVVTGTSFKDTTAVVGKTYFYTVVGVSRFNGSELTEMDQEGIKAWMRTDTPPSYEVLTDANGNVYDLGGMEIVVRDWWSEEESPEAETLYDADREEYLEWIQNTYNFTIKQTYISDWGSAMDDFIDYASQDPDENNYVFTLHQDYRLPEALSDGLCYDLATLDCLDFSKPKFQNNLTHTLFTQKGKVYAMYGGDRDNPGGYSEPRTGIFFNKDLLRDAGIDPDSIYDMQANGTWTWDALIELMDKVQRDIDGDGQIDVYAANANNGVFLEAAVYSNGGEFIGKKASGEYTMKLKDPKTMEALQFAQRVFDQYFEVEPDDALWDYYKEAFQRGEYAFCFEQSYAGSPGMMMETYVDQYGMWHETGLDWGFVMFPKGPQASDYVNCWDNNFVCIPSNYDAERAWKIAFAWNLYTNEAPGYEDSEHWKEGYRTFDERATNETLAMMRTKGIVTYHGMVPGVELGYHLTWDIGPGSADNLEEIVERAAEIWQRAVDEENESLGFATLDASAPELLSAEMDNSGDAAGIKVTWRANRGVSDYAIFRKKEGGSWRKIGTTSVEGSVGSFVDTTAVMGTQYYYYVRGIGANGSYVTSYDAQGISAMITAPVTITKQPTDFTGEMGKKASFTVEAVGDGLSYQWQYKKGSKWMNFTVTSAMSATLKITMNEKNVLYPIRCLITDASGYAETTNEVWLKVKEEPIPVAITITSQPVDWTGAYGKKASFSVAATGNELTYQWQYKKGTGDWTNYEIATANTANFQVTMNEKNVKWTYRCVITDKDGNVETTNEVHMKLKEEEPVIEGITITSQPGDWYGVYGKKASFNVLATGNGLTYQWQYKKGTGDWTNYTIATADTANFQVTMNEKNVKWTYRCVITDAEGRVETTNEVHMYLAE